MSNRGQKKGFKHTEETKLKISLAKTGVKQTLEHRHKLWESSQRGKESHLWRGGVSNQNKLERSRSKYKIWRMSIFERDDYTCQSCGVRGVELHADHIKQFAFYPELRYELSNGRTLCVPCHKETPTYQNKHKI